VEQHVEARGKEILPPLLQMRKERRLVLGQLVQTTIERVGGGQAAIGPEQIGHRALVEPFPVQTPFAARIDEPIADQRLEHVFPARAFAGGRKTPAPKPILSELLVGNTGQPASAPLPRPAQLQLIQANADDLVVIDFRSSLLRKQRNRSGPLRAVLKDLDRLAPGGLLGGIDFAQIKHMAPHHPASAIDPAVFDQAPVMVLLAVFEPNRVFEKHAGIR